MLQKLLAAGVDVQAKHPYNVSSGKKKAFLCKIAPSELSQCDRGWWQGMDSLTCAAQNGHVHIVEYLLGLQVDGSPAFDLNTVTSEVHVRRDDH